MEWKLMVVLKKVEYQLFCNLEIRNIVMEINGEVVDENFFCVSVWLISCLLDCFCLKLL